MNLNRRELMKLGMATVVKACIPVMPMVAVATPNIVVQIHDLAAQAGVKPCTAAERMANYGHYFTMLEKEEAMPVFGSLNGLSDALFAGARAGIDGMVRLNESKH